MHPARIGLILTAGLPADLEATDPENHNSSMRLLHTADWHLGDRLGTVNRTEDLQRAVERVAQYCDERDVETLLVAGDIFSERCRADGLRECVAHLNRVFGPFLARGGTIIAITGNHDNETFCRTLCHAMALAAPGSADAGGLVPAGRFYLAAAPTFFRLQDRQRQVFQFVLMPYPTERGYLDEASSDYQSLEQKQAALQKAFLGKLEQIRGHPAFDPRLPAVLMAHVHVRGSVLPNLFRMTEQQDIIFQTRDIAAGWAYVALGHIHRAQSLMELPHVRYSGSIERLDMGEKDDAKSVALAELGRQGLLAQPELLPLEATPFYDVVMGDPKTEIAELTEKYPESARALVRCLVGYERGSDDIAAIEKQVRSVFPRCYFFERRDQSAPVLPDMGTSPPLQDNMRQIVLDYLRAKLADHKECDAVLQLAEALLIEEPR
jgi:exonuclease SbcD